MEQRDMIRMANQIAAFFNGSGPEAAVKDAADHINKFWDPHMRTQLFAHLDKGGAGTGPDDPEGGKPDQAPEGRGGLAQGFKPPDAQA